MPKKKKYPNWFSSYSEPLFYEYKPAKEYFVEEKTNERRVYDGDVLEESENERQRFEIDYGSEDDTPSVNIVTYKKIKKQNTNYEKEWAKYEKLKIEHKKRVAEWEVLKKKYDEEQRVETEAKELKMLENLKKKYEHRDGKKVD